MLSQGRAIVVLMINAPPASRLFRFTVEDSRVMNLVKPNEIHSLTGATPVRWIRWSAGALVLL
jgi:hypothetical protein